VNQGVMLKNKLKESPYPIELDVRKPPLVISIPKKE
jgi:hypothetical protein